MNFPITGIGLLLVGAYFFLFAPRMLYVATVFLIPFSAMAVMNIGWGGGEKGIAAWIFMGSLWMVRTAISDRPFWHRAAWVSIRRSRIELTALLACSFISLLVPALLSGTAWVADYRLYSSMTVPLGLTSERVTQTGYFAFGVVFTIFVAVENCNAQRLLQSVKTYVASAIFASAWAFLQLWCILTGHTYPAFLFNNSEATSAQFYSEVFSELGLHRISSVGVEPSVFAFSMLLAFSVLLGAVCLRRPLLGSKWDMFGLLLITGGLLISTATTAYIGLVLAPVLILLMLARAAVIRWRYVIVGALSVSLAVAAMLTVPIVSELIDLAILYKAEGYSALERLHSIGLAAHSFFRYPILGVSWNAAPSFDLVMEVLASLGIVGFAAFAVFIADEVMRLWRASEERHRWALILFPTLCLTLILSETTGFPYALGHAWFIFGLGVSAPFLAGVPVESKNPDSPVRIVSPNAFPSIDPLGLPGSPQES
ncbi:MAG TPA: hypothetical protein VGS27_01965 [Candidatus Sulfotelmatobacter sp.]|nr:hypothetical protein [Candidatus Sulfotelmatobacter sp.]